MGKLAPRALIVPLLTIVIALGLFTLAYAQGGSIFTDSENGYVKVNQCESQTLKLVNPKVADIQLLSDVSIYCYNDVRRAELLGGSAVNRENYIHQRFENNIILVMVVLITCSGVILSGLQLLTSYNLAMIAKSIITDSTELTIERGKIALRSSVTGLLVLALSLLFFFIYVDRVYTIQETKINNIIEVQEASVRPTSAPDVSSQPTFITKKPVTRLDTARPPRSGLARTSGTGSQEVKLLAGGLGKPPK